MIDCLEMRGGRGGKGGKGGRGGITQDLLRNNLEDLGIDNPYNFSHEVKPALLYPPISLPPPRAVLEKDTYYIQKMREIKQRYVTNVVVCSATQFAGHFSQYCDNICITWCLDFRHPRTS